MNYISEGDGSIIYLYKPDYIVTNQTLSIIYLYNPDYIVTNQTLVHEFVHFMQSDSTSKFNYL